MKNKVLLIIFLSLLSLPISVSAVDTLSDNELKNVAKTIQENTLDDDIVQNTNEISYKQPVSKKKIAKKFLAAMGGVAISSILLFLILSVYNKLREKAIESFKNSEEASLESPEDINNAVKSFLDKTNWNG